MVSGGAPMVSGGATMVLGGASIPQLPLLRLTRMSGRNASVRALIETRKQIDKLFLGIINLPKYKEITIVSYLSYLLQF